MWEHYRQRTCKIDVSNPWQDELTNHQAPNSFLDEFGWEFRFESMVKIKMTSVRVFLKTETIKTNQNIKWTTVKLGTT